MNLYSRKKLLLIIVVLVAALIGTTSLIGHKRVDFSAEVKPLLNKKCISCHGGVKKEGGFSVLFREEALGKTESGKPAIIPGHPEKSELIKRLTSKDPEERMPYKHDPLSEKEIEMMKQWIKEGAQWGEHWAYVPVKPVEVPGTTSGFRGLFSSKNDWVKNDIDNFIFNKLKEEDLQPSPIADKATLLRRVSLDITGIPASKELSEKFLKDNDPNAYEKLVDTLLASPQYGERWTAMWLDISRYADSKGYEKDGYRSIWRYRDWLISAFNEDKPYDRFLTEQIAGDLLPNATDKEIIATAFNRNSMNNDEGGTDNEEFRTAAIIDRVNTTWETLLGTTFACVQCHSHPYDPFRHEDYYKFMAFFNNTRDEDMPGEYPVLREFDSTDQKKYEALQQWLAANATKAQTHEINTLLRTWQPAVYSYHADQFVNSELSEVYLALRKDGSCRLPDVDIDAKSIMTYRYYSRVKNGKWNIHLDSVNGPVIASTIMGQTNGWNVHSISFNAEQQGRHDLYFTYSNPDVPKKDSLNNLAVFDWFVFSSDFPGKGAVGYDSAFAWYNHLLVTSPKVQTPVMMENPDNMFRPTHVFERGNWLSKGQEEKPGVPHSLNPLPKGAPQNRLGLAMWLTSKDNPLTARTMVNRVWEQLMGQGIIETLEDMGTQGIAPTHQQLLDWLSWQFMNEDKWSVKKLIKRIVMSATYQQSSIATPEMLHKDQFNKYYARGPRVRLSAEQIRDQALAVSGLLSHKMFGKSVMPYQPDRIWLSPYDGAKWIKSEGEDQYRRAIYTYWKRTSPYPTMLSFDGVAREVCLARRIRTNTPLQALATLNDNAFIEMARHFAKRMEKEGGKTIPEQISRGYEIAMYHPVSKEKLDALMELYTTALHEFEKDKDKACEMINEGTGKADASKAAMIVVANAMMNLDEFITKN
ncbi:MAG: DUF1553 domain-containing protein [Terrimonas sp.]|nr:DUF1553 domain-containing protein [Terrimonas sp.]OJY99025.1 MAG: hypothetical protein BGP13_23495 [Sphingobacteriales bacterium 40-81]